MSVLRTRQQDRPRRCRGDSGSKPLGAESFIQHNRLFRKLQNNHDHGIGHGPEAVNVDSNSGQEGRLNDGHRFATFMMARAPHYAALIEKPDTRMQPFRVADDQDRSCDWRRGPALGVHAEIVRRQVQH